MYGRENRYRHTAAAADRPNTRAERRSALYNGVILIILYAYTTAEERVFWQVRRRRRRRDDAGTRVRLILDRGYFCQRGLLLLLLLADRSHSLLYISSTSPLYERFAAVRTRTENWLLQPSRPTYKQILRTSAHGQPNERGRRRRRRRRWQDTRPRCFS